MTSYLIDKEKCPSLSPLSLYINIYIYICNIRWEEGCNEEFLQGKGLNCSFDCEDKQLEEEHRRVAQPMANYCLADYDFSANVDCPNDWIEPREGERIIWGWTNSTSKKNRNPLVYFKK